MWGNSDPLRGGKGSNTKHSPPARVQSTLQNAKSLIGSATHLFSETLLSVSEAKTLSDLFTDLGVGQL